jgi:hypothetical protein
MRQREPSPIDELRVPQFRPPCTGCGANMWLARIEPTAQADHDLRTFECAMCGQSEVFKVKFR